MNQQHARTISSDGAAEDFAWVDLGAVQQADGDLLVADEFVASVEQQRVELLLFATGEDGPQQSSDRFRGFKSRLLVGDVTSKGFHDSTVVG